MSVYGYAWVALGGALGAVARMLVGQGVTALAGTRLPWHTFVINVVGSAALGFVVTAIGVRAPASAGMLNHLVAVGFLGAFTTFSTFELEIWNMVSAGRVGAAVGYGVLSVVVGFLGLGVGIWAARAMVG